MLDFVCCNEHICGRKRAKRCAVCELDFKYVAKDPVRTQSADLLCASCESAKIDNFLKCQTHQVATPVDGTVFNEQLVQLVSNELFEKMHRKFNDAIGLLQGLN
jgi:hypothetical protein